MINGFELEVLTYFYELDEEWSLQWCPKEGGINFSINVNDIFYWGCADSEDITEENFSELKRALVDIQALAPELNCYDAFDEAEALFAARMRKMRPQGCCYPKDKRLWFLFDAVGPERETNIVNPYKPGENGKGK